MSKITNIQFYSRSHTGKVRRNNEDCLEIDQTSHTAAIADGIGGQGFGEVASELAVKSCMEYLSCSDRDLTNDNAARELSNSVKVANETIITIQRNEPKYSQMGSTLSCFWLNLEQPQVHYSWVGDSRIYLLRPDDNSISMLTKDHTLDQSKINPDLAPGLYKRAASILTQMVGSILLLKPDFGCAKLKYNDIILACTDGLSDRIEDDLMLEYATNLNSDLEAFADKLLDRALDCGGQDNISFVLAKITN